LSTLSQSFCIQLKSLDKTLQLLDSFMEQGIIMIFYKYNQSRRGIRMNYEVLIDTLFYAMGACVK
jgi:hypothetical protein